MSKYQAYANYKNEPNSEWLGAIPKHWKVLRGKYVFTEINERSENGDEVLLSVSEYYGVKPRSEKISEGEFLSRAESLSGYKKCNVNDLVMNIMLAWKRGQGVSKYVGIVSPAYSVFRFFDNAYPDFMHYLFRTDLYTGHFKTRSTGVIDSRLRLYPESFFDVDVLIPSIEEQTQIAAFLDHETAKIDTLIEKQQQLIELLKEKRQAVISHAVTKGLNPDAPMKDSGVEWLGEVPEHWVLKPMNMASSKLAVGLATSVTNYYRDTGSPIIRNLNIKQGYFDGSDMLYLDESFALKEKSKVTNYGDVLMVRTGSNIGLACTTPEEFDNCHTFTTLIITPNKELNSEYLTCCINSSYGKAEVQKLKQGFGKDNLNVEELRRFQVIVPPITEQNKIVNFVNEQNKKIDKLFIECNKAISLMQERRTALISAAVTGKIDVRNWVVPTTSSDTNEAAQEVTA
ncbi:TPA: restriction endonuclease subunit S [Photobacterium damselae]